MIYHVHTYQYGHLALPQTCYVFPKLQCRPKNILSTISTPLHEPLTRNVKLRGAHALGMPGIFSFPRDRLQRKPLVSDPDMHHGSCVTNMPWWMTGSLTHGGRKTFPAFLVHAQHTILRIWQEAHTDQYSHLVLPTDTLSFLQSSTPAASGTFCQPITPPSPSIWPSSVSHCYHTPMCADHWFQGCACNMCETHTQSVKCTG